MAARRLDPPCGAPGRPWPAGARHAALALVLGVLGPGCEPGPPTSPADAGDETLDARLDAPLLVPDTGPPCPLSCAPATRCCFVAGAPACVVLGSDVAHCGACGNDCSAARRGDACRLGTCACGDIDIGCLGGTSSTCCLAASGAGRCADLARDFDDCGACDARCEAATADACRGGSCSCGGEGRACDGAAGETCCRPRLGGGAAQCVDVATDREHCGACQSRCSSGDVCRDGACVSGRDAGARDAGPDGGGEPDGGAADAGERDAAEPGGGPADGGGADDAGDAEAGAG